ncbi:MAG: zinc ribbon domain-containing protein [Desulfomonile sp.]|nr:zinc ribbon domain-containing protein [Desulfomonile sp.]
MPVYEYRCSNCGCEFEEWQRITDAPVDTCKSCGGKVSRLISRSSFILKGTGWYVTDYGRGGSSCCSSSGSSSPSTPASCSPGTDSCSGSCSSTSTDSSSGSSD